MKEKRITLAEAKQQLIDEYEFRVCDCEPEVVMEYWHQMYGEDVTAVENEDGFDEDIVLVIREG